MKYILLGCKKGQKFILFAKELSDIERFLKSHNIDQEYFIAPAWMLKIISDEMSYTLIMNKYIKLNAHGDFRTIGVLMH